VTESDLQRVRRGRMRSQKKGKPALKAITIEDPQIAKRKKDRVLILLLLFVSLLVLAPRAYTYYKEGGSFDVVKLVNKSLPYVEKWQRNIVGSVDQGMRALLNRVASDLEQAQVLPHLLADFNIKAVLEQNVSAAGAALSVVPRIFETEGDYALQVHKTKQSADNHQATIDIALENVIISEFTHLEFWMKGDTPLKDLLNVTLVLYSGDGESRVEYSFLELIEGWKLHRISLSDFRGFRDLSFISKISFVIKPLEGTTTTWDVYIDDIYLTKQTAQGDM